MTDRLSELAKALADASDRLNGTNHRDDQRLMEEVATRIQARVDDYDAAYAALEAYGLEKAWEGAVKMETAPSPPPFTQEEIDDLKAATKAFGGLPSEQVWQVAEPEAPYSNGLDGHNKE